MKLVNAKQMAIFLGLDSERRVQQLVREGMPKEAHGKYDPMRCLVWRVRDLQKKLDGKIAANGEPSTINEERLRLMRADAELKEIELARQRKLLVLVEDVEQEMTTLVLDTKARILAIAPRLAAELVGQQDSRVMIQAKVEKVLKDALLQLAKYEPESVAAAV
jgi:phage terminase Nu1 subunit (DNA packaging protein)